MRRSTIQSENFFLLAKDFLCKMTGYIQYFFKLLVSYIRRLLPILLLFLIVYYLLPIQHQMTQYALSLKDFSELSHKLSDKIAHLSQQQIMLLDRLSLLEDHQESWQFQSKDQGHLESLQLVIMVEQYVRLAQQNLRLSTHVDGAISSLENADNLLKSSHIADMFLSTRALLKKYIQELSQLSQSADLEQAIDKMDALLNSVDSLPLIIDASLAEMRTEVYTPPETVMYSSLVSNFWQQLRSSLEDSFFGLIRLQNINELDSIILSPQQTFYLRENIRISLYAARLSLLCHHDKNFHRHINLVLSWLSQFFDKDRRSVQQTRAVLENFLQLKLASHLPSLNDVMSDLQTLKRTIQEEGAQT